MNIAMSDYWTIGEIPLFTFLELDKKNTTLMSVRYKATTTAVSLA